MFGVINMRWMTIERFFWKRFVPSLENKNNKQNKNEDQRICGPSRLHEYASLHRRIFMVNYQTIILNNLLKSIEMETRISILRTEPEAYKAMLALENYLKTSKLTKTHKELIKIRASQINGCAYCINMHAKDARINGETEQRIYLLNAWRETDLFTDEEKALLALTEEMTLIQHGVSDETYRRAAKYFDEHYLAQAMMAIVTINAWNRISVTSRTPPDAW